MKQCCMLIIRPVNFHSVLCRNATAELNPVCAIVGGIAAQEIIKAISRDHAPLQNYFVYDGVTTYRGFVETIVAVNQ
jgi:hypothetical protein